VWCAFREAKAAHDRLTNEWEHKYHELEQSHTNLHSTKHSDSLVRQRLEAELEQRQHAVNEMREQLLSAERRAQHSDERCLQLTTQLGEAQTTATQTVAQLQAAHAKLRLQTDALAALDASHKQREEKHSQLIASIEAKLQALQNEYSERERMAAQRDAQRETQLKATREV
jgi:hypothetical protein